MYRRAYVLLIGVAGVMGLLAVVTAVSVGSGLRDPEGFLGPAWVRLPMLVLGALLLDMLPRALWVGKFKWGPMKQVMVDRWKSHWNRERLVLVVLGIVCFYITYVSYRNLKSFLPEIHDGKYDRPLDLMDKALFFGHEPAGVLQAAFGTTVTAHVLSWIYLAFLPMVPLMLAGWLVWSKNISFGYWFVTSQAICWSLGTAAYYALPAQGPGFQYPWRYTDLAHTPTTDLMESLSYGRVAVMWGGVDGVQSVAAFASLHTAVTLLIALMAQYTIRATWVHWVLWINFGLTIVATLYFGWHYVVDDIAGVAIAVIAFYLGGLASGQKFDRRRLSSHPTTTTSKIPIDRA